MHRPAFIRHRLPVAAALLVILAACTPIAPPAPAPVPVEQAPAPPRSDALVGANVKLTQLSGLSGAIAMANRSGSSLLYFANQDGLVVSWNAGVVTPVLDLQSLVKCCGEQGLLGMTFNPAGTHLYVHYSSEPNGATQVDEFVLNANPATMLASRRSVFTLAQPQANHNGGSLLFSPIDGLLYLALGDGGGFNDGFNPSTQTYDYHRPSGSGQDPNTLLGKLIRVDPTDPIGPATYTIPPSNPFVGASPALDEIWSLGLRNPYRISFDRSNGDLWIGDVGQGLREEIDHVAIGDATHPGGRGANFGWNRREGNIPGPDTLRRKGTNFGWSGRADNLALGSDSPRFTEPVNVVLTHSNGECAVIGGYVYRGAAIPDLFGAYVFTDLCNEAIRAFTPADVTTLRTLHAGQGFPVSFGEDNNGELYVLSGAGVWRIDNNA